MKVSDLQAFIRSLIQPLDMMGAAEQAGELGHACAELDPFKELGIKEFTEFLAGVRQFTRTGALEGLSVEKSAEFLSRAKEYAEKNGILKALPKPKKTKAKGGSKSKAVDMAQVKELAQHVLSLYERAADDSVEFDAIKAEVEKLDEVLSKDAAVALAREVGIAGPLPTKRKALEQIHRKIAGRKEIFQRVQF